MNLLLLNWYGRVELIDSFRRAASARGTALRLIAANQVPADAIEHFVDGVVKLVSDDSAFHTLAEAVKQHEIDLVIPIRDEDLIPLMNAAERTDFGSTDLLLSPLPTLEICNDKLATHAFAPRLAIRMPEFFVPRSLQEIEQFQQERLNCSQYPIVLKPRVGSGATGVYVCRNHKQLLGAYLLNDDRSIILEKYIEGRERTTDVYCDRSGAYVASCSRRRLSVNDGEICSGSIDANPALTKLARTLSEALPMRGPFNFQTIEDASGEIYLLEINSRLSGGSTFSIAAGWDLPGFILDEFCGKPLVSQKLRNRLQMVRYMNSYYWDGQ